MIRVLLAVASLLLGTSAEIGAQGDGGGWLDCRGRAMLEDTTRSELANAVTSVPTLNRLAWALLTCGEFDLSARAYRRILLMDPVNRESLIGLAILNLDRWELHAAEEYLARALSYEPENADARWLMEELRRRYRLRVEAGFGSERGRGNETAQQLFVGAGYRLRWNVHMSAAYDRHATLRITAAPSQLLAATTLNHQGWIRFQVNPGKFTFVAATSYFNDAGRGALGGGGVDGGVTLTRHVQVVGRADVVRVPGGAVAALSPAVIARGGRYRPWWTRLQYFYQDGVGIPARADIGLIESGIDVSPRLTASIGVVAARAEDANQTALHAGIQARLSSRVELLARYRRSRDSVGSVHLLSAGLALSRR